MDMRAIDYAGQCHFPLLLVLVDFAASDAFWRGTGTSRDFDGMPVEAGRMYGLATLHHYHHELHYHGRLSGYSIGDGFIDDGEEDELLRSLELARQYCEDALKLDILFGEKGVDYFRMEEVPIVRVPASRASCSRGRQPREKPLQPYGDDRTPSARCRHFSALWVAPWT